MRGVGGPLLCIGDLLKDVGEEEKQQPDSDSDSDSNGVHHSQSTLFPSPSFQSSHLHNNIQHSSLLKLFQENYDRLSEALGGTDHSWTALTLELCNALETANKLVKLTNSNVSLLSEKVGELESIINKGDHAIAAVSVIHDSPNLISQNMKQLRPDN